MPSLEGERVLVTGGAGFIGSHLVDLLRAERNAEVIVLDNLDPQTHGNGAPNSLPHDIKFYKGDVRNLDDLRSAISGVRYIFHLAAYGGFVPDISKYMDVNATGTVRLYEALRDYGDEVQKVLVASSQGIYGEGIYIDGSGTSHQVGPRSHEALAVGEWEHRHPHTREILRPAPTPETHPHNTNHIYSISKYAEERVALALGAHFDRPTCCLRFAVTYGPRQSLDNPYTGVVSIFSTQILNGLPPLPYEDGQQTRDFVYVKDVARGALFAMEHEQTAGQVYNLSTGVPTTLDRLARALAKAHGSADLEPVYRGVYRPSDVRHLVLDPSRLAALGFLARTDVDEGLSHVAQWLRETNRAVPELFRSAEGQLVKYGVVRQVHESA